MPNSLIHYAGAALVAHGAGLRGRARALIALVAVLPDLDVITAIPWMIAAPHLPLGVDGLMAGGWLLGHRGFSHTFLAAVVCGVAVWAWKRDRRLAWTAGIVWATHVVLDIVTPWPTTPFWPFSAVELQRPLVTTLDPLLTVVSLVVTVALLAPLLLPRVSWPSQDRRDRWARLAEGSQGGSLVAVGLTFVVVLAAVPVTALALGAPISDAHPAGFPGTVLVERTGQAYVVSIVGQPWVDDQHRVIPMVRGATDTTADQRVATVRCVLEHLGPYGTVGTPAFVVEERDDGTSLVRVVDVVRNVTRDGGPETRFVLDEGRVIEATMGDSGDDGPRFQLAIPQAVVEAAPCP